MKATDLLRLMPLALLAAILLFFQAAAPAVSAPDFDLFPEVAAKKALVLTQPGCPPCARN